MPPRATRHAAISRPVRKADSDAALVASRSCARSGPGSDGASTVPSDRWRACVTIAAVWRSIRTPSRRASSAEENCAATTAPIAAVASRLATRAIALLTAEAIPALPSSASASTAAVSGATVIDSPSEKISSGGSTSVRNVGSDESRESHRMPLAATSGPKPMSGRGPMRSASAPKRRDSRNITIELGTVASPASIAS